MDADAEREHAAAQPAPEQPAAPPPIDVDAPTDASGVAADPAPLASATHSVEPDTPVPDAQGSPGSDSAAAPAPPPSKQPLFRPPSAQDLSNTSTLDSSASTAPPMSVNDDEIDQLDTDSEADVPLALATASGSNAPSPRPSSSVASQATAASPGGAIAGPGPSSSAHIAAKARKRGPDSPASSSGVKKKKPRASHPAAGGRGGYIPPPLPHYTVIRSSSNSKSKPHILKVNDDVTDGDESRWPPVAERQPTNKKDGKAFWYECMPKDQGRHKSFLEKVGEEMAKRLGLMKETAGGKQEHWILDSLPKHHLHTVHHCTTSSNQARTDVYVFGSSATLRFRTPNEFAPHLYWLLVHGPDDNIRCDCKYCTGKTQGDVNRQLGLSDGRSSSSAPEIRKKDKEKVGERAKRGPRPSARPVIPKAVSPPPTYKGAYIARTRDEDLGSGALYRIGELVWAQLPTPFTSTDPDWQSAKITHWPGIVMTREVATSSSLTAPYEPGALPQIKNVQRFVYKIRLLAAEDTLERHEESWICSWLGHSPARELWSPARMANPESVKHVWDGKKVLKARLKDVKNLEEAVTPTALAMQIAAHIVSSFSLNDRYILAPKHVEVPGDLSAEDHAVLQKLLQQYAYQSLHWGAELIWTHDFVRIMDSDGTMHLPRSKGSSERALFMHVYGVFKDEEQQSAMLAGELWEMKDLREHEDGAGEGAVVAVNGAGAMSLFEKKTTNGATGAKGAHEANGPLPPSPTASDSSSSSIRGLSSSTSASTSGPSRIPAAPEGFEFRRLSRPDEQVRLSLDHLAGRYYPLPKALNSRRRIDEVLQTFAVYEDETAPELSQEQRAVLLAGLGPAIKLHTKCGKWSPERQTTLVEGEIKSAEEVQTYFAMLTSSAATSANASPAPQAAAIASLNEEKVGGH
ncbi:hypothetical protein JCM5296_007112 [Sporobolomyces johnsonii]